MHPLSFFYRYADTFHMTAEKTSQKPNGPLTPQKMVCIPCVTGCDFNVIQRRPFSGFYITPGKNTDHAQEQRLLGKLPPRTGACPESKGVLTRIRLGGLFIPWGRRGHETIGIERFRLRIGAGIV